MHIVTTHFPKTCAFTIWKSRNL